MTEKVMLCAVPETGEDFQGATIKVIVGTQPNVTEFTVHKDILCKNSGFFTVALNGNLPCSTAQTVELQNYTADLFNLYLNWVYHRIAPLKSRTTAGDSSDAQYEELARAYCLGDELVDEKFRDMILDSMALKYINSSVGTAKEEKVPPASVVRYIYEHTALSSPLKRLVTDIYTHCQTTRSRLQEAGQKNLPPEFLFDLSVSLLSETRAREPWGELDCGYHIHRESNNCYRAVLRMKIVGSKRQKIDKSPVQPSPPAQTCASTEQSNQTAIAIARLKEMRGIRQGQSL